MNNTIQDKLERISYEFKYSIIGEWLYTMKDRCRNHRFWKLLSPNDRSKNSTPWNRFLSATDGYAVWDGKVWLHIDELDDSYFEAEVDDLDFD